MNLRVQVLKNSVVRLKDPNSFVNNFSYSFLANVIVVSTQLFLSPIITRYYSPAAYGMFTSIFAFALNIATFITFRYEYAILIEKTKTGRDLIARFLVLTALAVSLGVLFLFFLERSWFNAFFDLPATSYWLISLPVLIFLQVVFQVTGMEITLRRKYKDNFIYGSSALVLSKGLTLSAGSIWNGHFGGMLAGDIFLRLAYVIFRVFISLQKKIYKYVILLKGDIKKGWLLLKKYKQFPLYELPTGYISLVVNQSHLYFLTYLKEKTLLGLLGVSFTVMDAPMRLFSYSIAPILMQKVGEFTRTGQTYSKFLTRVFLIFYTVTTVPLIVCQFWSVDIFSFVFGEKWQKLGIFVSAFLLFYFFRIEVDIYENLLAVAGFNRNKLVVNLCSGIARVTCLLVTYFIIKDLEKTIVIWGFLSAIIYFILSLYYSWLLGIRSKLIVFVKIVVLLIGLFTFVYRPF